MTPASTASARSLNGGNDRLIRGSGVFPAVHQPVRRAPEDARQARDRDGGRARFLTPRDVPRVADGPQTGERVELPIAESNAHTRDIDGLREARPDRVLTHDVCSCSDARSHVKRNRRPSAETAENGAVTTPATRARSPIAERVRARLAEMRMSERAASEALRWTPTVLSTILRKLDQGGAVNSDTLRALEQLLGRPAAWILTGDEPAGVLLSDCPGWAAAAREARDRYGLTDEQIAAVARCRFPAAPRHVDALLIRAISDAI